MSIYFVQLVLCPAIRLFNLIESQTWWINLWTNHFAYSWINSMVKSKHDITTQEWKRKLFSPTRNWTAVPCNQKPMRNLWATLTLCSSIFVWYLSMCDSSTLETTFGNIHALNNNGIREKAIFPLSLFGTVPHSMSVQILNNPPPP